ncbi:MAG: DUF4440 domain-containing protein [Alphaproteobacteria bacterium]|nr:DUF4440 domain-containing protein [Alphaproteobacteria bacterium]
MGDEEAVLFANDRFYAAFAGKDVESMERLWGSERIICVHPGWPPLHGREEVMESWQGILGEDSAPEVRCRTPRVTIFGNMAIVVCIEELEAAFLCATNVFVREDAEWRLIHHQAGPVNVQLDELPDEPEVALS